MKCTAWFLNYSIYPQLGFCPNPTQSYSDAAPMAHRCHCDIHHFLSLSWPCYINRSLSWQSNAGVGLPNNGPNVRGNTDIACNPLIGILMAALPCCDVSPSPAWCRCLIGVTSICQCCQCVTALCHCSEVGASSMRRLWVLCVKFKELSTAPNQPQPWCPENDHYGELSRGKD